MPPLLRFLLARTAAAALTLFGALVFLFLLIQNIPGDPVTVMLGPRATHFTWTEYPHYWQLDYTLA